MQRLIQIITFCLLFRISQVYPETPVPIYSLIEVEFQNRQRLHNLVRALDLTPLTIEDVRDNHLKALARTEQIEKIRALGFKVKILLDDYRQALDFLKTKANLGQYHNYAELDSVMHQIAADHSSIAKLDSLGKSVQGRWLWALKISNNPAVKQNKPRIRLIGAHHGNELISVEVPLYIANVLTDSFGISSRITDLVNNREIWIIPMMNPDGVELGQRWNANGVDLNRDYGYMWEGEGFSDSVFSQPETRAIRQNALENTYTLSLSYHSGAVAVNYIWNYDSLRAQDDSLALVLSNGYASYNGYWVTNGWDWYQTNGDCNDFSYGTFGDIDWTIELSYDYAPPESLIDTICRENKDAILYIINKAGEGIRGVVTDAISNKPVSARINVLPINWPVYNDTVLGDYHRVLLPGTYDIRFAANGYVDTIVSNVPVTWGSPTILNVAMRRDSNRVYAYQVVSVRERDPNGSSANLNHTLTPSALGAPDSICFSLGVRGNIVLDMGKGSEIVDDSGADFRVYECIALGIRACSIFVSNNWSGPWIFLEMANGTTEFDLAISGLTQARYIRLADDGDGNPLDPYPGFDLDAVKAIHSNTGSEEPDYRWQITDYRLMQNYPNPFSSSTEIRYQIADNRLQITDKPSLVISHQSSVSLKVYNLAGQLVRTLVNELTSSRFIGMRSVVWDAKDESGKRVAPGVYFYRLTARQTNGGQVGDFTATKKMILLR
ncbi:MAG: M14 family zinc carboxypeptidase [Candidatus Edwardsbacteria bacterium]